MSEESKAEGFGDYHPEAAGYGPYNDAMAAWRNQVRAMQAQGGAPNQEQISPAAEEEPQQPSAATGEDPGTQEPSTPSSEPQQDAEGVQGTMQERDERTVTQGDSESGDEEVPAPIPDPAPEGQAEEADGPKEVYDPADHTAPEVLDYLKGVGEDEAKRVLESEEAGKNRKGITSLKDDILAKARENDETGSGSTTA